MTDDYVIGAVIGAGLLGRRFAGRYRPSGHPVALEEVPHTLLNRPDFVERLAFAARQTAAVTGSHVIAVYDLVRLDQRLYVVTELVPGRSLAALLGADRALPLPTALLVVDSVLAGLEEIHHAHLTHGDVCPDVVVITPTGDVRITGLGVAAALAADPAMPAWPAVQPPEGGVPSAAADLYATGALLRELVSGMRPEEGGPWPGPGGLEPLVSRSLAPTPAERFPSAVDFRQELESAAAELLGTGWQAQSDLAGRAIRPLGPQAPRHRSARTVTVSLAGTPAAPAPSTLSATGVQEPSAGVPAPQLGPPLPPPPPPPPVPEATASLPGVTAPDPTVSSTAWRVGPDPFEATTRPQSSEPGLGSRDSRRDGTPLPRMPRKHRRRHLAIALTALFAVAVVAAAVVVLLMPHASAPAGTGPLRIGDDVRLTVQPSTTGTCGTTFTFTATGSLSGAGTLTYRWVKSTAGGTPVYNQYSVTITPSEGSFRFTTPLQLTGPATLDGTVSFQVLSPQTRTKTQTIHYSCTH
jgi:serine/threonine-protein kinase